MPLAYTIPEVIKAVGIGRTKLYQATNAGALRAHKIGKRTIIKSVDSRPG